ncbi:MAG: hypothetical protein ACYS1A_15965 [Planctomycetota bacterium]|jgi:hypothetical protein
MKNQETTTCKYCGKQTPMLGTKLCDPCWELSRRIEAAPDLALEILTELNKTPLPPRRPATKIEIEAVGAICNLQDKLHEASGIIRKLLVNYSSDSTTWEQAIIFLKKYNQIYGKNTEDK